jgi:hypothetical protein
LKTAVLNSNGSLTLGYSENLSAAIAASDLKITLNSKVVASGSVTVIPGTGSETNKDVITVETTVDKGIDTNYGGSDDTLYIDVDGIAGYLSGTDILISTGSYTAANDGATFDLNNATSLKVATIASPVTDDADNNTLKGDTTITVK